MIERNLCITRDDCPGNDQHNDYNDEFHTALYGKLPAPSLRCSHRRQGYKRAIHQSGFPEAGICPPYLPY
jgi:hypothetical protein